MFNLFKKVSMVALLYFLVFGCASQKKKLMPMPEQRPVIEMDESFDPLTLDDEDITFEPIHETKPQPAGTIVLPEEQDSMEVENKLTDGYRIQLLSTKSLEAATESKQIAMEQFEELGVNFYLEFDSPYYKVRMGDYLTREEAERDREIVRSRGYPKAWIVPSRVWTNPKVISPSDSLNIENRIQVGKN